VLSFCYVNEGQGAIPLLDYLNLKNWKQEDCGLINIPHIKDIYALFYGKQLGYKGIMQHEQSNELSLSSIPKEEKQQTLLYFNKDGYSSYCKEYKEYWDWVKHRNEARYQNTQNHGKNYDAKNMMHTFRLLEMALEIAREKQINVQRPNREFLLEIKNGKFEYKKLLEQANILQAQLDEAFKNSDLPEHPDLNYINQLAYELREDLYREGFH